MKRFLVVWGKGYIKEDSSAIFEFRDQSWFTVGSGYQPADIEELNKLQVGEGFTFVIGDGMCQSAIRTR